VWKFALTLRAQGQWLVSLFRSMASRSKDHSLVKISHGKDCKREVSLMNKIETVKGFNDSVPQLSTIQAVAEFQRLARTATQKLEQSIDRSLKIESQTQLVLSTLLETMEMSRNQTTDVALMSEQMSVEKKAMWHEIQLIKQELQNMRAETRQAREQMGVLADSIQKMFTSQKAQSEILMRVEIALPKVAIKENGRTFQPRLASESLARETLDLLRDRPTGVLGSLVEKLKS